MNSDKTLLKYIGSFVYSRIKRDKGEKVYSRINVRLNLCACVSECSGPELEVELSHWLSIVILKSFFFFNIVRDK